MARVQINPTTLAADNAVSNLTTLLTTGGNPNAVVPATGAGNGIIFTNIVGVSMLMFSLGATACTATVQVGMQSLPIGATTFAITIPVSATSCIGAFHSILSQPGTTQVAIDFSSNTGLVVALFQTPAVY
jgi:hypothetical protein